MKVLYVAGPYRSDKGSWGVHQNIRRAEAVAYDLWSLGAAAICPHKNTEHFDGQDFADAGKWLEGDLAILDRCDALVLAPNWESSTGTAGEIKRARERGIPVFDYWQDHKVYAKAADSPLLAYIREGAPREE